MSFPRYDSYRDSGVEWLGEVPDHWGVVPFWSRFKRTKRLGFPLEQLLSVYRDYGVIRKADRDDNFNKPSDDLSAYQLVEPGDLAFNKMKAWQGSVGISRYTGIVSPAYFVFQQQTQMNSEFFHYMLRSNPYACGYMAISKGIRINQWDVDPDQLAKVLLLVPPPEEQTIIAAFLDRETGKIDGLIEEQRRLVVLLKEKRQAVISHAVTKGLSPTAPLKPSGIEWLGDVPAHWEVVTLKRVATVLPGNAFSSSDFATEDGGYRLLRGINVSVGTTRWDDVVYWNRSADDKLDEFALVAGDLVIGMDRPWIGDGLRVTQILKSDLPAMLLQRVAAIRVATPELSRLLLYNFQSGAFFHHCAPEMTGVSVPHISGSQIESFSFPFPPILEAQTILGHIEAIEETISGLVVQAQSAITLLQERRAALISAAVTGKIDVRGAVAAQPKLTLIQGGLNTTMPSARIRLLVATQIVGRLAIKPTFGRTQLQKHLHLAQYHLGIDGIDGAFMREAAGPLDRAMLSSVEDALVFEGFATASQERQGYPVTYNLHPNRKTYRDEFVALVGADKANALTALLSDMADFNTQSAEAVSTLYAVWNDFLIDGIAPTDEQLFHEIATNWHPNKSIPPATLTNMLAWMRRKNVVPKGNGTKTIPTMTGTLI